MVVGVKVLTRVVSEVMVGGVVWYQFAWWQTNSWYLALRQVEASDGWYVNQEMSRYAEIINNRKAQCLITTEVYFSLTVPAHLNICVVLYVIFTWAPRLKEQLLCGTLTILWQWEMTDGKTTSCLFKLLSRDVMYPSTHASLSKASHLVVPEFDKTGMWNPLSGSGTTDLTPGLTSVGMKVQPTGRREHKYKVCLEKVHPLVIEWEVFVQHWCNPVAKEGGLKCICVNNDDFTILDSRRGRHHWVSMCTMWPSHSKWLSK